MGIKCNNCGFTCKSDSHLEPYQEGEVLMLGCPNCKIESCLTYTGGIEDAVKFLKTRPTLRGVVLSHAFYQSGKEVNLICITPDNEKVTTNFKDLPSEIEVFELFDFGTRSLKEALNKLGGNNDTGA